MNEITISQITTGMLNGDGNFDTLMSTINDHIAAQYEKNRITSSDFGVVYLGAIQTTLEQAINFTLSAGKTELEEKILQAQLDKLELEKQLATLQVERAATENLTARVQLEKAQKELAQLDLQSALIAAQTAKTNGEVTLTQQQVNRTVQETELVKQKLTTEKAQTTDGYAGVVGKQMQLYQAQATGFTRDSEQKAAKLVLDIVATQMTQDDAYTVAGTNLHATAIGSFVNKLATGIGVTIPPAP